METAGELLRRPRSRMMRICLRGVIHERTRQKNLSERRHAPVCVTGVQLGKDALRNVEESEYQN